MVRDAHHVQEVRSLYYDLSINKSWLIHQLNTRTHTGLTYVHNMVGCSVSDSLYVYLMIFLEYKNHNDKCPVEWCSRCFTNPLVVATLGTKQARTKSRVPGYAPKIAAKTREYPGSPPPDFTTLVPIFHILPAPHPTPQLSDHPW